MAFADAGAFFSAIDNRMQGDETAKAALKEIGATYQFTLNGDGGGGWTMDLSAGTVTSGNKEDADCIVTMEARDFVGMVNQEEGYQGQQLFMLGKLMIAGDMTLAMQLEQVFSQAG